MKRMPNLKLREVPGGFVQRVWMGDRFGWLTYDEQMNRLKFTAHTYAAAVAKLSS